MTISEKIDSQERKTERRVLSIVDYKFSEDGKWIYRLESGQDNGCDCSLEMSEDDNTLQGKKAYCQVKGRSDIHILKDRATISFDLEASTYNMAVNANFLFILLLVDLTNEEIYFVVDSAYLFAANRAPWKMRVGRYAYFNFISDFLNFFDQNVFNSQQFCDTIIIRVNM